MLKLLRLASSRLQQRIASQSHHFENHLPPKTSSAAVTAAPSALKVHHATMATSSSSVEKTSAVPEENFEGIIKFLEVVGNLKHIKRAGWMLRNVKDCETVAGHMYRMSIMTFLLEGNKDGLDRSKCLELALVHDLAESLVGDITPYCGVSKEDKKKREIDAMHEIAKMIEPSGKRLLELFLEYEENQTPESKFVKDLDRLDMVLQAYEYEKRDNCPLKHQEFFDSTDGKFNHPLVVRLVEQIKLQRGAENANEQANSS